MKRDITITPDNTLHNSENKSFKDIKTFKKACEVLDINYNDVNSVIEDIIKFSNSKSAAAMFKLNIIKKALNLGQELSFTKNPEDSYIYYPFNPIIRRDSIYYNDEIEEGKIKIVGKFKVEGEIYLILGDSAIAGVTCFSGLSAFNSKNGSSQAFSNIAFLGCASREIAEHFSRYFGTLITEAKYGDLKGFEIIRIF